ncbi:MAG: hypothetical protein AAGA55_12710, partial [Planctomycetota bacterium]
MLLTLAIAGTPAIADIIYSNDFENDSIGSEWSDTTRGVFGSDFTAFLGRFEMGTVRLTLGGEGGTDPGEPGGGSATNGGHAQPYNGSRNGD